MPYLINRFCCGENHRLLCHESRYHKAKHLDAPPKRTLNLHSDANMQRTTPMDPQEAAKCCGPMDELLDAELFKALGDPTRLKLLSCLAKCGRPCSVTELTQCCAVDLSVVSRHLSALEKAGVLSSAKEGRTVFYTVRYKHLTDAFRSLAKAIEQCRPKRNSTTN